MKKGGAVVLASIASVMLLIDLLYSKKEAGKQPVAQSAQSTGQQANDNFLHI